MEDAPIELLEPFHQAHKLSFGDYAWQVSFDAMSQRTGMRYAQLDSRFKSSMIFDASEHCQHKVG